MPQAYASRAGSQPVEWTGQAFPYLMHHPKDPSASHSYARAPAAASERPSVTAHGVWDGPAPRGYTDTPTHAEDAAPKPSDSQQETVTLSSGQVMPLLGIGTYKLENVDALKLALDSAWRVYGGLS